MKNVNLKAYNPDGENSTWIKTGNKTFEFDVQTFYPPRDKIHFVICNVADNINAMMFAKFYLCGDYMYSDNIQERGYHNEVMA